MKVLLRLFLVAGAAATVALLIRDPLATRVARALEKPTRALAAMVPQKVATVSIEAPAPRMVAVGPAAKVTKARLCR